MLAARNPNTQPGLMGESKNKKKKKGFNSLFIRLERAFISRSSRSLIFFKLGVLKNLSNFTGKHLCWSLFLQNTSAGRFCISIICDKYMIIVWYLEIICHCATPEESSALNIYKLCRHTPFHTLNLPSKLTHLCLKRWKFINTIQWRIQETVKYLG